MALLGIPFGDVRLDKQPPCGRNAKSNGGPRSAFRRPYDETVVHQVDDRSAMAEHAVVAEPAVVAELVEVTLAEPVEVTCVSPS